MFPTIGFKKLSLSVETNRWGLNRLTNFLNLLSTAAVLLGLYLRDTLAVAVTLLGLCLHDSSWRGSSGTPGAVLARDFSVLCGPPLVSSVLASTGSFEESRDFALDKKVSYGSMTLTQ